MLKILLKRIPMFVLLISNLYAVGGTISLQGVLRDPDGTTVTDGYYSLTIKLYENLSGGTALFTEVVGSAAVQNGVFSIEIGATTASSSDLVGVPFDVTYYVGVTVESGTEMAPRTKLTVSPYSMALYGSSNIVPNTGNVGLGTLDPQAVVHIKDVENNSGEDLLLLENNSGADQFRVEDDGTLTLPTLGAKVGIGTATPSAMLDISSAGTSDDFLTIKNGSGTEKLVVDSDGGLSIPDGGRLGIGTATPSAMLDISSAGTSDDFLTIKNGSGTEKLVVDSDGDLTIPDGGRLGIGTSSPSFALDITAGSGVDILSLANSSGTMFSADDQGNISINSHMTLGDGGQIIFKDGGVLVSPTESLTSLGIANDDDAVMKADATNSGSGDIKFQVYTSDKMIIKNSGNVGIGTTSPSAKLDVVGTAEITSNTSIGGTATVSGALTAPTLNTGNGANELYAMNQNVRSSDSPSFAGLTASGNITVTGTVDGRDLSTDGSKLDGIAAGATNVTNNNQLTNGRGFITSTVGSAPSFNKVRYNNPINGYVDNGFPYYLNNDSDGGSNAQLQWWYNDPEGNGYNNVGTLLCGNGGQGWISGSDRRLKQNIRDYPSSLDKLLDLRPVTYNWKTHPDADQLTGFIAQNVRDLFPRLTTDIAWKDKGTRLGVNYSLLVVPAIKAIQEQQEIIDQQEKNIQSLIKRIEALEAAK